MSVTDSSDSGNATRTVPPKGGPSKGQGAASARQLTVLLIALLLFYAAPVLIAAANWLLRLTSTPKSIFDQTLTVTALLLQLAQNKKEYLGLFHQLIVPVLAAFTAFGFRDVREKNLGSWLFTVPLALLLLSVVLSISFSFITDLPASQSKLIADLFVEIAQNLSVYVLMLVGLEGAYRRKE
jgi:hypothetical protein